MRPGECIILQFWRCHTKENVAQEEENLQRICNDSCSVCVCFCCWTELGNVTRDVFYTHTRRHSCYSLMHKIMFMNTDAHTLAHRQWHIYNFRVKRRCFYAFMYVTKFVCVSVCMCIYSFKSVSVCTWGKYILKIFLVFYMFLPFSFAINLRIFYFLFFDLIFFLGIIIFFQDNCLWSNL